MSFQLAVDQGAEAGRYFYLLPTRAFTKPQGYHVSYSKKGDYSGPICAGDLLFCQKSGLSAVGWVTKPDPCKSEITIKGVKYKLATPIMSQDALPQSLLVIEECPYLPANQDGTYNTKSFLKLTSFNEEKKLIKYDSLKFRNSGDISGLGSNLIISYILPSGKKVSEPVVRFEQTARNLSHIYKSVWHIQEENITGFKLANINQNFSKLKPVVRGGQYGEFEVYTYGVKTFYTVEYGSIYSYNKDSPVSGNLFSKVKEVTGSLSEWGGAKVKIPCFGDAERYSVPNYDFDNLFVGDNAIRGALSPKQRVQVSNLRFKRIIAWNKNGVSVGSLGVYVGGATLIDYQTLQKCTPFNGGTTYSVFSPSTSIGGVVCDGLGAPPCSFYAGWFEIQPSRQVGNRNIWDMQCLIWRGGEPGGPYVYPNPYEPPRRFPACYPDETQISTPVSKTDCDSTFGLDDWDIDWCVCGSQISIYLKIRSNLLLNCSRLEFQAQSRLFTPPGSACSTDLPYPNWKQVNFLNQIQDIPIRNVVRPGDQIDSSSCAYPYSRSIGIMSRAVNTEQVCYYVRIRRVCALGNASPWSAHKAIRIAIPCAGCTASKDCPNQQAICAPVLPGS